MDLNAVDATVWSDSKQPASHKRPSLAAGPGFRPMVQLSILDQVPVRSKGTPESALAESVSLAVRADQLGYRSYLVAEHHGTLAFASPCPEVVVARIASVTSRMRVGAGGIMLTHYSAYKVAETFCVLENMFPGRIELGIGRAPGGEEETTRALADGAMDAGREFASKVDLLIRYLRRAVPSGDLTPAEGPVVAPRASRVPYVRILSSTLAGASLAARLGLPLCFAHFINPGACLEAIRTYRATFVPSAGHESPETALAVFALCGDDDVVGRAQRCLRLQERRFSGKQYLPFPSADEAAEISLDEAIEYKSPSTIIGDAKSVRAQLLDLADRTGSEEFVVVAQAESALDRLRSYELLSAEFGMRPG